MENHEKQITRADLYKAVVLGAASLVFLWLFIHFIERIIPVLELFTIGLLIALVLEGPLGWLERHKIPRIVSIIILFLILTGLLFSAGYLLMPPFIEQLTGFAENFPRYWERLQDSIAALSRRFPQLASSLNIQGQRLTERILQVLSAVQTIAYGAASALVLGIALLFVVLFTISNPGPLVDGALSLFPRKYMDDVKDIIGKMTDKLIAWVQGTLITMLAVGVLTWVGLTLAGVPFPIIFAIIAGLLEVLPTIGPVLSAVPPVLVALSASPVQALYVILVYLIVQQIESNLLVPYVMSTRLQLHPLSLLFTILVLASFLGIFGALIATPVTAIVKILYEEIYLSRIRDRFEHESDSGNEPEQEKPPENRNMPTDL